MKTNSQYEKMLKDIISNQKLKLKQVNGKDEIVSTIDNNELEELLIYSTSFRKATLKIVKNDKKHTKLKDYTYDEVKSLLNEHIKDWNTLRAPKDIIKSNIAQGYTEYDYSYGSMTINGTKTKKIMKLVSIIFFNDNKIKIVNLTKGDRFIFELDTRILDILTRKCKGLKIKKTLKVPDFVKMMNYDIVLSNTRIGSRVDGEVILSIAKDNENYISLARLLRSKTKPWEMTSYDCYNYEINTIINHYLNIWDNLDKGLKSK